jgi:hypothetical protein
MSRLAALCLIGALVAAAAMPACAQSVAYSDGLADRTAYEQWFGSLESAEHDGATFWSAQRSKPHPPPCTASGGDPNTPWVAGCRAAQLRLAPVDARRRREPEYRLGWNAYQETPPVAAVAAPSPPPASIPATNRAYSDGFNDSKTWGKWFRSLVGEARKGAEKGAIVPLPISMCPDKNLRECHEIPCIIPGETRDPLWISGCQEARRLAVRREERKATDPEYKRGWESASATLMEQYRRTIGQTAFVDCVKAEVRFGMYSSRDGDASVKRLIKQCQAQAEIWFNNCTAERNESENDCYSEITFEAAITIAKAP